MSDHKSAGGLPYGLSAILRGYGLGGVVLVLGIALIGLSIYKGSDFADETTQLAVLIGGPLAGLIVIAIGSVILLRGPAALQLRPRYEVYIAAPMAGFGADEGGRKAAVDLVNRTQAALQRAGVQNVYTPVLARPEAAQYETPSTGFDVEWQALRSSKRYLLILPPTIPERTSVLVTAGMAVGLGIPMVVLAHKGADLPYLIAGAVQSGQVKARRHDYEDVSGIEQMIENDGLRLFGE